MFLQRAHDHPDFEIAGVRVSALVSPSHGGSDEAIMYRVSLRPGQSLPTHRHDHDELYLVLEGGLAALQEGTEELVQVGDSVVIPAGAHHGGTAGDDGAVLLVTMRRGTLFIPDEGDPRVPPWGV
jgi:quercetin dioxygenase-like cupin family protein